MISSFSKFLVGHKQQFKNRVEFQRTLLTSHLLLLSASVTLIYSIIDMLAGLHDTFRFSIPFFFVLVICFVLLRTGKRAVAKILFLLSANAVLFAYASTATFATGTSFYFIVTSIGALVLFGYEERTLAVLFPCLSLILFVISYFTDFRPFAYVQLSDTLAFRSFVINFLATLVASTFEVLFLMRLNYLSEKEISESKIKIEQQNIELVKANGDLDRFVYSASHDLRAPLSSIMGLVNLAHITANEAELRNYLEMVGTRVRDLDRVIKDILDYSRNNRTAIQLTPANIEEIIQQVWDDLRYDANASKIEFVRVLPEKIVVTTDKDRLKIILANLFSNAIKYANLRNDHPQVRTSVTLSNGILTIEVADNGIGIGEEHKVRIFEMFYRATDKGYGSGLGLFIAKEAVEKLNGEISMNSELGKGTTFKIQIPVSYN